MSTPEFQPLSFVALQVSQGQGCVQCPKSAHTALYRQIAARRPAMNRTDGIFEINRTGTVMLNGIKSERCKVAAGYLPRKHDTELPRAKNQT
jgi:hypothetical protein